MARQETLVWTKRSLEGFEIDHSASLRHPRTKAAIATISTISAMYLERLTDSATEEWTDVTGSVTIANTAIIDGALPSAAIRFTLAADKDTAPPGGMAERYMVIAEVVLSNGQGETIRAPLSIPASAAIQ